MKKPLLLTLSFMLGISSFASIIPVSAAEFLAPGDPLMTIDEVLELHTVFDAEATAACTGSENWNCVRDLLEEHGTTDRRYKALRTFLDSIVLISSINISERTMQVVFNSKNYSMMLPSELEEEDVLKELRFGWSEPNNPCAYFTEEGLPKDPADAPAYFHYIYNAITENDDVSLITPYTKFSISWSEPGLELLSSGYIQHTFRTSRAFSISGTSLYKCVNSEYYRPGMECRATFSKLEGGGILYLPYSDGVPAWPYAYYEEDADSGSDVSTPSDTLTTEPTIESGDTSPSNPNNSDAVDNLDIEISTPVDFGESSGFGTASEDGSAMTEQAVAIGNLGQFTASATAPANEEAEAKASNDKILWFIVAWLTLVPITIFFGVKRPKKR